MPLKCFISVGIYIYTLSFTVSIWRLYAVITLAMCTGQHFGGLLDSAAANAIVEQKIESALKGPEGTPPSSLNSTFHHHTTHASPPPPSPHYFLPLHLSLSLTTYSLFFSCVCVCFEGFVLTMLGVDHSELKSIIRKNVQLFLADISPIVSIYTYYTHVAISECMHTW